METAAHYTFWTGVIFTAAALAVGLTYALVPRLALRSAATSAGTVQVPVVLPWPAWLQGGSRAASWLAIGVLTAYLGFRWAASGLPPVSNMWEYTVAFGWAAVVGSRLLDWRLRAWGLSLLLLAGALALFAVAELGFSSAIRPAPATLKPKHLLAIHAGTMLAAYGAFAVSFAAALGLLLRRLAAPRWLPARDVLMQVMDRAVILGFPLFTAGLAAGSYWMNSIWGKYWDWDTKASSSLAAWLLYAGYLHVRALPRWRDRAAYVAVAAFGTLMFSYFGVNLWL